VGVDARTVIFNKKLHLAQATAAAQQDTAIGWRIPGSIFKQMAQNPPNQVRVEPDRSVGLLDHDGDAMVNQLIVRLFDSLFQKRAGVQRLGPDTDAVRFDFRHLHRFPNEGV
jgi:hypothetical protein